MLPFDTEITADMQGETQQRVKRIAGLEQKPNALAPSPATSSSALADLRSVVAACWLIYGRLLGRIAWYITLRKVKKPARPKEPEPAEKEMSEAE